MNRKLRQILAYIGYYLFVFFFTYRMFLTAIGGRINVPIPHIVGTSAIIAGIAVFFVVWLPEPERQPITEEDKWGEPGFAAGNKRDWLEVGGVLRTLLLLVFVIASTVVVIWALTFLEVRPPPKF
jgi:hypothetical protein